MQSTTDQNKGNLVRQALLRQATALHEQATALEALAELAKGSDATGGWVTSTEAQERFGMGKAALVARGFRRVKRGRSWVWSVAEIEEHLATHAAPPRPRKCEPTGINEDPIDQMIAAGELVARGRE